MRRYSADIKRFNSFFFNFDYIILPLLFIYLTFNDQFAAMIVRIEKKVLTYPFLQLTMKDSILQALVFRNRIILQFIKFYNSSLW